MLVKVQNFLKHLGRYSDKYLTVIVVLSMVVGIGCVIWWPWTEQLIENTPTTPLGLSNVLGSSSPVALRIPKINLTTGFELPLGVMPDGSVAVPQGYEQVGWYKYGPTPGEMGPAVILGHVDSYQGPAIFYNLRELTIGDEIYVDREDGSTATFIVTKIEQHPQSNFPTDAVYGNIDHAGLRLVTCAGTYNKGIARYSHNLIVYGRLKE